MPCQTAVFQTKWDRAPSGNCRRFRTSQAKSSTNAPATRAFAMGQSPTNWTTASPPLGYVTTEDLANRSQIPNQDPDDQKWGSVADLREQARSSDNIKDITPFLGPIRAIVLFYCGRRRQGDVAHFCELSIARRAVEGFRLVVCVVDIVHGPKHDIYRGGAFFSGIR